MKRQITILSFAVSVLLSSCGREKTEYEKIKSEKAEKAIKELAFQNSIPQTKTPKEGIKKLKEKKDEFKNSSFYMHKKAPRGYTSDFEMYIAKGGIFYNGRIVFKYKGDDWLFVQQIHILCDGRKHTVDFIDGVRDNDAGEVYEKSDQLITENLKSIIKDMIDSKEVKIRYEGKEYIKDRKLGSSEKQRLKEVYESIF